MNSPKDLLEAYLQAKDFDRPSVILETYAEDAVLTYSIATDTIAFPARVVGADAIAQTLVRDFRKKFDCCKTYYVCDSAPAAGHDIDFLPWLVIMREVSSSALRLGKGYYRWAFAHGAAAMRVSAMHIHIERMDVITDDDGAKRQALHDALPYPWLPPRALRETLARLGRQPAFGFVADFRDPLAGPT
jgi:hypothetical protein